MQHKAEIGPRRGQQIQWYAEDAHNYLQALTHCLGDDFKQGQGVECLLKDGIYNANMMTSDSPYATGGGGWVLENLVASYYAAKLLGESVIDFGARIERIYRQTDTPGFDDIRLILEPAAGHPVQVDIQVRRRQYFTARNQKFQELLEQALLIVHNSEEFKKGDRALAIVVDSSSPAHREMRNLCDLARTSSDSTEFSARIDRHGGSIKNRWKHVKEAINCNANRTLSLFNVLKSLHIRDLELEDPSSTESHTLLQELALLWRPPDQRAARNLYDNLFRVMTELGREAGSVDRRQLKYLLGTSAPPAPLYKSRIEHLYRLLDASYERISGSLVALGVDKTTAHGLVEEIGESPPITAPESSLTVLTGPIGVGKSTEIERHHRRAVQAALRDYRAPVPVWLRAHYLIGKQWHDLLPKELDNIGYPAAEGVHLVIDGLDEVGVAIEDLLPDFNTFLAHYPNSRIIISSRSVPEPYAGEVIRLPPLADEETQILIRRIRNDGLLHAHGREERMDLLRRPLFAIQYALSGGGSLRPLTEAQLVNEIGRRLSSGLNSDDFEAISKLAVKVVDAGGRPVAINSTTLLPPTINALLQTRLVSEESGGLRFQLGILTEWFASFALRTDPELLARTTETYEVAKRWRYVHTQALLQADAQFADYLMETLTSHSPGTAAWVMAEASNAANFRGNEEFVLSDREIRERLLRADRGWFSVLSSLQTERNISNPEVLNELRVSSGTLYLTTYPKPSGVKTQDTEEASEFLGEWKRTRAWPLRDEGKWPWEFVFQDAQSAVAGWLSSGIGLQTAPAADAELAYAYAAEVLEVNEFISPKSIDVKEFSERIQSVRKQVPSGSAKVHSGRKVWWLHHAEHLLAALESYYDKSIGNPWPGPDERGSWVWLWWTNDQLLHRVSAVSKEALNIYQQLVEGAFSRLRNALPTYSLLPGKVRGIMTAADPQDGWFGGPIFEWYIQPQPFGASNASHWEITLNRDQLSRFNLDSIAEETREIRGHLSPVVPTLSSSTLSEIYTLRPASQLALKLLHRDLKTLRWSRSQLKLDRLPPLVPLSRLN